MHLKSERIIHYLMCSMGGFLGCYALLLRGGFGSAATGNLLSCMISISYGDLPDILIRIGGGLMFLLPFMISKYIEIKTDCRLQNFSLLFSSVGLIILAILPESFHPILALYPLFLMTGFQWSAFGGINEYPCSTIFISNNVRQCFSALAEYLLLKDTKKRGKSLFYGFSILCFLTGGLVSSFLCGHFGPQASFWGLIILLIVKVLMIFE